MNESGVHLYYSMDGIGLGDVVMVLRQPQNASHAGRIDGLTQSVVVACTTIISYGPALRHRCRHRGHTFY